MRRSAFTVTMSIILIVVSLFSLVAVGLGMRDVLAIKKYKEEAAKEAEAVGTLEEGIEMLRQNEQAYLEGIGAYEDGLAAYASGKAELNKGYGDYNVGKKTYDEGLAEYNKGKKTYEEGLAAYEEGKKALAEGKKRVAEGQAQIDENTQAYLEGKEKLEKVEPLLPYVDMFLEYRAKNLEVIPGFGSLQAWFASVVRPIAQSRGLDIPDDVTDFAQYIEDMVADGKAQIKMYEDGLIELEAGKQQVAEGEAQLAEAEKQLADGKKKLTDAEKQLADGKKELQAGQSKLAAGEEELRAGAEKLKDGLSQLEEFEDGMKLVDENLMLIYTQDSVYRHSGELAIGNPQETLGKDFSWYKKTEDGEVAALRNGDPYVDLDKGMEVCTEFRAFVDAQHDDCQSELYSRVATYAILALAAILGIVAGTLALCGKGFSGILGIVTASLVVIANILGAFTRYFGYTYPLKDGTYSGTVQLFALLFTLVAAVLFAVASMLDRSRAYAEGEE